jgi:hypothetical protein
MKIAAVLGFSVIASVKAAMLFHMSSTDLNLSRYFGFFNWKKYGVFFW